MALTNDLPPDVLADAYTDRVTPASGRPLGQYPIPIENESFQLERTENQTLLKRIDELLWRLNKQQEQIAQLRAQLELTERERDQWRSDCEQRDEKYSRLKRNHANLSVRYSGLWILLDSVADALIGSPQGKQYVPTELPAIAEKMRVELRQATARSAELASQLHRAWDELPEYREAQHGDIAEWISVIRSELRDAEQKIQELESKVHI
jgi:uncharacterized protein YhaN